MVANKSSLAKQVVTEQYEELMQNGLPFLQIFPEMIQEANIAETCYSCKLNLFYYISQVTGTSLILEKYYEPIDYLDHLSGCNILLMFSFFLALL